MKKTRYTCKHCNHTWVPRKAKPKRCPRCRRSDWNPIAGQPFTLPVSDNSVFPGLFNK